MWEESDFPYYSGMELIYTTYEEIVEIFKKLLITISSLFCQRFLCNLMKSLQVVVYISVLKLSSTYG